MKYLSFLIKPSSSLCNLRCTYCFYQDVSKRRQVKSYGIMKKEVMEKVIERAFEAIDDNGVLNFAFQGGEPMLSGIEFFQQFASYVEERKTGQTVYYSIQTNGVLINDEWASFFAKKGFLVGVSLDGYESNTNYFRKDEKGNGVYGKIMDGIGILKKHQVPFNILTVLTNRLAKHPDAFYSFIKDQEFPFVQCIPCLGELEGDFGFQLEKERYFSFYKRVYDLWLNDYIKGEYRSIYLFDNLLLMLCDRPPQQCGMLGFCSVQFVIESNGNVYPCDFYVLDEYYCGNLLEDKIEDILKNTNLQRFIKEEKKHYTVCDTCPFWKICRGGCKRQNVVYLDEKGCGHKELLEYIYPTLSQIAKHIR